MLKLILKEHCKVHFFLRRPQKLTKSSLLIWHYVVSVKSMVKIWSIFEAFLENTNFNLHSLFRFCFHKFDKKLKENQSTLSLLPQISKLPRNVVNKQCQKTMSKNAVKSGVKNIAKNITLSVIHSESRKTEQVTMRQIS